MSSESLVSFREVDGELIPLSDTELQELKDYQDEYTQRLVAEREEFFARVTTAQAELAALGLSPEAIATISKYPYPFSLDGVKTPAE